MDNLEYKEELVSVQNIELNILKTVINICETNEIEYFIIGGTVLGSVRHGGFIPWDDDIDIGMRRAEYERFKLIAPQLLPKDLFFQCPETESNDPFPYVKIRQEGTEFVEYCNRNRKMHRGVYIDVFPFDAVPENNQQYKHLFEQVQFWSKIYSLCHVSDITEPPENVITWIKFFVRRVIYYAMQVIPNQFVLTHLERAMKTYDNQHAHSYACLLFPKFRTEHISDSNLYPLKEYKFESLVVNGPANYDVYLSTHYGEYMQLPSKEKRVGHRPYILHV